ncbi:hypothetical protein BS47DRAFT_1365501 [Hydnum rufescens UP504]|uniref:Uncharacterized protein n=1 Tax=Hydnum rufescens UP504 TaxID=1448309 RepID=A0A9P6AP50_9AGAM|nr:hypothetical protein BS47DRAFT_1365501 [Hydnum rufescens UP504]
MSNRLRKRVIWNWVTSIDYNWPKFEYFNGMYVYRMGDEMNWTIGPIFNFLHLQFPIQEIEGLNQQDPTELEQDHTPTTLGVWSYRFKVLTSNLHNDDTKPDGHLEINMGQNLPNTPHTCAACTRQQIKHGTTHPLQWVCGPISPQTHAMTDRYGTTPAAMGVVLSDTMTGKVWYHTHCGGCGLPLHENPPDDKNTDEAPRIGCGNLRSPLPPTKPDPTRTWTELQQEIWTCAAAENLT